MTKQNPKLEASKRELTGRKVNKLRKEGILPATMYGNNMDSMTIQMDTREVEKLFEEVGESGLIDLVVDGKEYPILLRNPQYNILTEEMTHVDCYKVNLKVRITAAVPVEIIGEAPGVKAGNVLVEVSDQVEIEALPADLPEKLEIDISSLVEAGDMITAGDIKLDDKMELKSIADQVLVKIEAPRVATEEELAEEEAAAAVAPSEVPATSQKEATDEEEGGEKEDK